MITIETVRYGDRPKFDLRVSEDGEYKYTFAVVDKGDGAVEGSIIWDRENPPVPVMSHERNMAFLTVLRDMGYDTMFFSTPEGQNVSRAAVFTGRGLRGVQCFSINLRELDQWR